MKHSASTGKNLLKDFSIAKLLNRSCQLGLGCALAYASIASVHAATINKANNADNLNLTTSWNGGFVPSVDDVAAWDSTVTGANSTLLGADLTWKGLLLTNPGGLVTIGAGNVLTIGRSGIDMSAATQNLTLSSGVTIGAGNQVWNIGAGRTLTLNTGTFTRAAGATLNIQGTGTVATTNIANLGSTGIIGPWATIGTGASTRYATVSAGTIVSYTGTAAANMGAIPNGNQANNNYEAAGLGSNYGNTRNVNTIRYTGVAGTFGGVSITLNGFMNAGGALTLNNPLIVGANNDLVINAAAANLTLGGVISGASKGLTITGANTTTLSGVSTYSGATSINNGTLNLTGTLGSTAGTAITNYATFTQSSAGIITGSSSVTNAAGTTTLNGVNSYSGVTSVTGGTLTVGASGAINASSGIVINGTGAKFVHASTVTSTPAITVTKGTLDGTGTVGAVTVGNGTGGIVTNGNGSTSALTIGSLTFNGAGTINVVSPGAGAGIIVTGALTTTPANGQVTINASGVYGVGPNNLVSFGSFGGVIGNFTLGTVTGLSSRQTAGGLSLNGNNIALTVNGDNPVWTGVNFSQWDTGTTGVVGGTPDWALKTAHTATDFWTGDTVEFNDTYNLGAGNVAVTATNPNIVGGVSPSATTFNNSAIDYLLSSSDFSGIQTGILTKNGTGKVTITSQNTYTGVTTINNGTLQIGDGSTDGSIATTAGIVNNASLIFNRVGSFTYTGPISGTGSVTMMGSGIQLLSGSNTYSGGTIINGGTLRAGSANALGAATNALTFGASSGGKLQLNGNAITVGALNGDNTAVIENSNATNGSLTTSSAANGTFAGILQNGTSGNMALVKNGTGQLTLGGINTYTGATTINNGTLSITGSLGATTVTIAGGTLSLDAAGAITSNNIIVGPSGTLLQNVDNAITGTAGINAQKNITLSRPNTYTGDTTVNTGSGIVVLITSATAAGSSRLNVGNGITTGPIFQVHIDGGGTIATGYGVGSNTGLTSTIDVNNNGGGGTNGVIQFNHATAAMGNSTLNVTGGNGYSLYIAQINGNAGSSGAMTFNPTTASLTLGNVTATTGSARTLALDGTATGNAVTGTISNGSATMSLTKSNTSTWTLSGANTFTGDTNLTGGTLILANSLALQSSTVNYNNAGGTLSFGTLTDVTFGGLSGAQNLALTNTTPGPVNLTIAGNTSTAYSGGLSGTGSNVIKNGGGTLTLSGTNTYTGSTTVNNGVLLLSGTGSVNGSSGIAINSGKLVQTSSVAVSPAVALNFGTVDGTGTITTLNVADDFNNKVANGNGGTGALTVTNLNFAGQATLNLNKPTGSAAIITTNLTTSGTGGILINVANANNLAPGANNLITYTGSIGGSGFDAFALGDVSGLTFRQSVGGLTNTGSAIALTIIGGNPVWTGLSGNSWTTASVPNPKNWTSGGTPTDYIDNGTDIDSVVFDDTATGTTTVNIADAFVAPLSTTFNNSTASYTITGNALGGSGSVTKNGAGTVTIANFGVNSYTGVTRLNGGVYVVNFLANGGATSDLGAASNAATNLVFNGGTLRYNPAGTASTDRGYTIQAGSTATLDVANAGGNLTLTGGSAATTGQLIKTGAGTLTLTGRQLHTGGTTVNQGTLALGLGGGTGALNGTLTINSGATVSLTAGDALGYTNTGTAITTVNVNGGILNNAVNGNQGFITNYYLTGGTVNSTGGGAYNFDSGFGVNSLASATTSAFNGRIAIRAGTVPFTAALGTTSSGIDLDVTGVISSNGGNNITKGGLGAMRLSGTNTYTGTTAVTAGTLIAASAAALGTTAGGTTVSPSATLDVRTSLAAEPISVSGTGVGGNGALISGAFSSGIVPGLVTVTGATSIGGDGNLTSSGGISGAGQALTKVGNGTLSLSGTQTYASLTTNAGTTNVNAAIGTGTSSVSATANSVLNFSSSQTLSSLNIGAGAVVTMTSTPSFTDFGPTAGAVVPEPGTFGLLMVGALGLAARRRRTA